MHKIQRILIIGPSLDVAGGVSGFYNSILPNMMSDKRFKISYLPVGEKNKGIVKHKIFSIMFDIFQFLLKLIIFRPHIIHVNPSLAPFALLRDGFFVGLSKLLSGGRIKHLVFFRGWNKSNESFVERFFWFFQCSLLSSDHFITLSEHSIDKLKGWGVFSSKISLGNTVINNDIIRYFSNKGENTDVDPSKLNILIMSRIIKAKGIYELVNAFASVLQDNPKWTLTIAGDGCDLDGLKLAVNSLNIRDNIDFTGHVFGQEKLSLLERADVFCLPSYSEGMPNSVLEAFAAGLLVIATPVGALSSFIKSGWVIPIEVASISSIKSKLLSENLISEIHDSSKRNKLLAQREFTVDKTIDSLFHLYLKMSEPVND